MVLVEYKCKVSTINCGSMYTNHAFFGGWTAEEVEVEEEGVVR